MLQILTVIISVIILNACSSIPNAPSVLVLPGSDKSFSQFQKDDLLCRQLTSLQTSNALDDTEYDEERQQLYNIYYIQCMYSKGHRVPVPGDLKYNTQKDWHPPPPPNLPAPPQMLNPGSSSYPMQ